MTHRMLVGVLDVIWVSYIYTGHPTVPRLNCHATGLWAKAPSWTKPAVRPDLTSMPVYQGRKNISIPFGPRTFVTD